MKPLATWLFEYGEDHKNAVNRKIHRICVPLIFFTVIGLLYQIPVNGLLADGISALAMGWYAMMGWKPCAIMLAQWMLARLLTIGLELMFPGAVVWILIGIFVVAWIGQFIGHNYEGRRPSFLTDLKYLLIGPLWVVLGDH